MYDHTREDGIQNDSIRGDILVAPIEEKMTENHLRWFGHIQRSLEAHVRRVDCMDFNFVKRGRGRPRRRLREVVKRDLMVNNISQDLVFNQAR